ncbi:TonB-dependent receptor domain-containing protein [Massilia pseudoviolaceinigra]|uniref:TonB-dependent receptor domain-containing protein n=1 Tax=Massilia pseudoviolaceinigra TaxID=3057165 RepID=UPI002796839B|nr:TonB-dependent receptor [Massilia sp. CCM 9206]MDQ1920338.1 TonB-dependent receptor [Massilia sp. CCM 9206]
MKEKSICAAIRLLCMTGLIGGSTAFSLSANAQEAGIQRVEITGSAIKRIAKEGALPVQFLSAADIQKTGAKSVEELVQSLSSMQGFTTASESVNGGGGGVQNASIHSIGAAYTLVLLNGRRIASYGSGSAVNLASIPMSAVERVEILTDGASTLYGSDAIAGVINFILKKNQQDFRFDAGVNRPGKKGGGNSNFSMSKGFGDLDKDGYNFLVTYAHDAQRELNAKDRDFAKTGLRRFNENGKTYSTYLLAANTAPASATLSLKDNTVKIFSPDYYKTGACAPDTAFVGTADDKSCWYDYAGTVQLVPKSERDSLFSSFNMKLNPELNIFGELVLSKYKQTARYAPAAQRLSLPLTGALYANEVVPYLGKIGVSPGDVASASMNIRFTDAGGRTRDYITDAKHLAFGASGMKNGFDYSASFTHSENSQESNFVGGFLSKNAYNDIVASGQFNPFGPSGSSSAVLAPAILHTNENKTEVKLDRVSGTLSHALFDAPGGTSQLALSGDYSQQRYNSMPSPISQGANAQQPNFTDTPLGDSADHLPVAAKRNNWGASAEWMTPLHKTLEVTAAARYDAYSAVKNSMVFDPSDGKLLPPAEQGNANKKATYKLAFRFTPVENLLFRGSYGTGFKVASMDSIASPTVQAGNTSGAYACPVKAPDPRAAYCTGTTQQYLLTGGNNLSGASGLRPETSEQFAVGVRFDPVKSLSLGLDLWSVSMKDQLTTLPEQFPFADPVKFNNNFSVVYDQGIGANKLVTLLPTFNLAAARYRGIDWDNSYSMKTGVGKFDFKWNGTYMLKSEVDVPGSPTESSVGRFDAYNNVTARIVSRLSASWASLDTYTNTLAINFRSGYHDQVLTADDNALKLVNDDGTLPVGFTGLTRDVKAFTTVDWQTRIQLKQYANLGISLGIRNVFDAEPPLSIRTAGGGNQAGFDARYASPLGRQFYVTGGVSF